MELPCEAELTALLLFYSASLYSEHNQKKLSFEVLSVKNVSIRVEIPLQRKSGIPYIQHLTQRSCSSSRGEKGAVQNAASERG